VNTKSVAFAGAIALPTRVRHNLTGTGQQATILP
jgi:hypothetical protein